MASMDQGNVLPLALGSAITTSYNDSTTSSPIYAPRAGTVSVFLNCTTLVGSPLTTVTLKIEARDRDGIWYDVQSKRQDTGAANIEHDFVLGAAPQTERPLLITCTDHAGATAVRVRAKGNAVGNAGDVIEANVALS